MSSEPLARWSYAAGSIATTVLGCLLFVGVVLSIFVYSKFQEPVLAQEQLSELGVVLWPTPRELNPFELETADGARFTNADLEGRWSFLYFGFTNCPDICPTSLAALAQARRQLQSDAPGLVEQFQGVMVSVDPERDTAEKLLAYLDFFQADFRGVRGERDAVATLATDVNVAFAKMPSETDAYTIDHTGNIVIINPMGHYHGFIKLPHQTDTLVQVVRTLASTF
ncbi:MAG: SCO family protein [Pseudomonadota bacterium]